MDSEKILGAFRSVIDSLNAINNQVWSVAIMVLGGLLALHHNINEANILIGGGLGILQHKPGSN